MSKNTHYIYYFNLRIEKYALNLFEPNQYVVARLAAPVRSWDLKIKAEFANLVSAPVAHSVQLSCT